MYVDDPVVRGSCEVRDRLAAMILLFCVRLGFPLAFHKAIHSATLQWIGVTVAVEAPLGKLMELKKMFLKQPAQNVLPKAQLPTIIGKGVPVASVIFTWRAFIKETHAALHAQDESFVPKSCIWAKQVARSVKRLLAVLDGELWPPGAPRRGSWRKSQTANKVCASGCL